MGRLWRGRLWRRKTWSLTTNSSRRQKISLHSCRILILLEICANIFCLIGYSRRLSVLIQVVDFVPRSSWESQLIKFSSKVFSHLCISQKSVSRSSGCTVSLSSSEFREKDAFEFVFLNFPTTFLLFIAVKRVTMCVLARTNGSMLSDIVLCGGWL